MSLLDTLLASSAAEPLWLKLGESVTYEVGPDDPSDTAASSSVTAIGLRSSNVGASTGEESQAKAWRVRASEVTAPKRGDKITDAAGLIWHVFDVATERGGSFRLETRYTHAR